MSLITFLVILLLLVAIELLYFRVAIYFNILDRPNHRSSHTSVTIRGGGVLFPISVLIYGLFFGWQYGYFIIGMYIISLVSFIDDINPISSKIRLVFHLIAVILLFIELQIFSMPGYVILSGLVVVIGIINAVNFMDGINGITGGYFLVALSTLLYINIFDVNFCDTNLLITGIVGLCIFNFFNFRLKARCFAGDVGSVAIAFLTIFLLGKLILATNDLKYILLLFLYGLDTISTIVFRILRRENILEAHRSHYYQFLANEKKIPHVVVSLIYIFIQLIFNMLILEFMRNSLVVGLMVVLLIMLFVLLRFMTEGKSRLLTVKSN